MPAVVHVYHEDGDGAAMRAAIGASDPGREVVVWTKPHELVRGLGDVEVLFTPSPPRRMSWSDARRLRLVQLMGVGADELLPAEGLPDGVAIGCLRGVFAAEVCEHVFAMMLALVRGVRELAACQERREWKPFASTTLEGKTIGILGTGAIGRRISAAAYSFGMHVRTFSRRSGDLRDVMRSSDVLVICLPRTPATEGLIDRSAIAELKQGAIVINVARGGVVDEAALLEALARGDVAGAALDVFADEPLPKASPWWSAPNVIVTPHVAGFGVRYVERAIGVLLENVRRLEANEPFLGLVDRIAGY